MVDYIGNTFRGQKEAARVFSIDEIR